jgi:hypothetical protein
VAFFVCHIVEKLSRHLRQTIFLKVILTQHHRVISVMLCSNMRYDDDEPLNSSELAQAMRFSRWSLLRCKRRGYKMEYGNRSSLGHFKKWLRANPIPDGRCDRIEDSRAQAAMV